MHKWAKAAGMGCYIARMLPKQTRDRRSFGRLRQRSSGRWQAGYTGPDGRLYRAPNTFQAKDDATAWLSAERKLIDLGEWLPPSQRGQREKQNRIKFAAYADKWLANRLVKGQPLKPRTTAHYKALLKNQLAPTFGAMPVASITREDVEAWYADQGSATPTLTAHAYSLLRTILGSAVEDGLLTASPCHIRGAGTTRRAHKVEPLTLPELEILVEAMLPKHRLLILLATWCALRFGELAELRRSDIDLKNGRLKIRRGVVRVNGQTLVGTPKTDAGSRDVAIPPHLIDTIKAHLAEHAEPGRNGLVFPAANGGHLAPTTLYGEHPRKVRTADGIEWRGGSNFYRARALAGRPDLRVHDLRHTGAVLAAQTGATLAELMSRLGHSTPDAAMRYQHASVDRDALIARRLSEMAGGA